MRYLLDVYEESCVSYYRFPGGLTSLECRLSDVCNFSNHLDL